MKDKFEAAIDKVLKNSTTTQWIFSGKEDGKTLAGEISTICNSLHQQAMKEAVEKAIKEERERVTKDLEALFDVKQKK